MAGQKVGRCTTDNASACVWMPVSVPAQRDGGGFEGGEPMMIMLRCSVLVVILAMEFVVEMDLREARIVAAVQSIDIMVFASNEFAAAISCTPLSLRSNETALALTQK